MWILGLKGLRLGCNRASSHHPLPLGGNSSLVRNASKKKKKKNRDKKKNKTKTKFHNLHHFSRLFPGMENWFPKFNNFLTRIQDSVTY